MIDMFIIFILWIKLVIYIKANELLEADTKTNLLFIEK